MKKTLILSICILFGLQGCKSTPTQPSAPAAPAAPSEYKYIAGEFNQESLYDLMLAELAGQQRRFPLALANYITQARKTGDSGVAERATRIAQYLRDPDKILETSRLWRQIDTRNPEPYQIEANILLHKGQYQAALPLIRKALEFDALRTLALIRGQANRIDTGVLSDYIQMLQEHQSAKAPRADLALTLALLYRAQGNTAAALNAFNQALSIDPESPEALIQKAELLRNKKDILGALQLIEAAFKQQPENRQLHTLYTQLLFQAQQTKKAVAEAQTLIENNLKDYQLTYYLALLMLENEAPDSAKKTFNRLLDLKPEDTSPNFYLGHIEQSRNNKEAALAHYIAVTNGNNVMQSLSRAVSLLNKAADRTQIEHILANARAKLPDQAPRLFTLEAEWLSLHNFSEDALTLLDDALSVFENDTTLLYTRAMMVESSDFPTTEKDLRKILELEPENAIAQNALGYTLLLHTERYEEALQLIQSALNREPQDPAILDSMGWALFKLERYKEALPYLEKAHALYSDPEVSNHLIQTYWALGQKQRALDLLKKSQASNPDNPFLEEAAQLITIE